MRVLNESEFQYIVGRLVNNALENKKEADSGEFFEGKNLAYFEMLDIIKNELICREADIKEYGLDFELDEFII
ncbi:MAG: transposase [Clostridia bacterium]|nr:transposase [Clostridia bacterium]